uniref:J domain-containing protein n=1 Tax=Aegilops tauschii subsp. strangulata TaxID=200361 RepID=A0A452YZE3_AEGTS
LMNNAAGNESFQARRYSEAVEQYSAALAYNSDSRPFSAVCFCNRAAAYQALGQLTDAIADCSLAMVLDANYPKAISRRATLYEMIRDYGQSANDLRKLISLLQKQANKPGVSPKVFNKHSDLKQARARLLSAEDEARKDTPLNFYLILGVEPSCSPADVKKAYRKAALRHHPDKATQLLVRNENADDGFWRDVAKEVYADADHLFKTIGEAYNILSDPDKD